MVSPMTTAVAVERVSPRMRCEGLAGELGAVAFKKSSEPTLCDKAGSTEAALDAGSLDRRYDRLSIAVGHYGWRKIDAERVCMACRVPRGSGRGGTDTGAARVSG